MSTTEMTTAPTAPTSTIRRTRRTPEQQLADLHAQLATLKERAERTRESAERAQVQVLSSPASALSMGVRARSLVLGRARAPASSPLPVPTSSSLTNSLSLDAQIQSCIESFSSDIVELIQRTTLDAIERTLRQLAFPGGGSTDNEPRFQPAKSIPPTVPTGSGRPVARARPKAGGSPAKSTGAPLSFDHYERMAIQRAIAEANGDVLAAGRLLKMTKSAVYRRIRKLGIRTPARGGTVEVSPGDPLVGTDQPLSLDAYEKAAIIRAIDECEGDIAAAARVLRVGKSTLYRRMVVLGIPRLGGTGNFA